MKRPAGFSLLELVLVLALAGLLAAVVVPSLPGALESARLRGSAADVRATLALARTLAVSDGRSRTVAFDLGRGEYGIDEGARKRLLPEGIRLSAVRVSDVAAESGVARVRFYPDGSADAAEVAIASEGGGGARVSVDPLTGIALEGT